MEEPDKLEDIREVYFTAYESTQSFETDPELTGFILYSVGVIATHSSDSPQVELEASTDLASRLREYFDETHCLWRYVKVAVP